VKKLVLNKAPGIDETVPEILASNAKISSVPLWEIYRSSLDTSVVPEGPMCQPFSRRELRRQQETIDQSRVRKILESIIKDDLDHLGLQKYHLIERLQHVAMMGV